MQLTHNARKGVAIGLAASTVLMMGSLGMIAPAFAAPHAEGCNVLSNGTVYYVLGGQLRGFPSAEVFYSWGNGFGGVQAANADDLALPTGPVMVYADGTLVKGPNDPLVYLVANGQKRGFTTGSVFTGLGFKFSNIQSAPANTFADLPTGANLDSATERHTAGVWVLDSTGTVWRMTATGRVGLPSMAVFNSWGKSWSTVVAANAADLAAPVEGVAQAKPSCSGPTPPPSVSGVVISTASGTPASSTVPKAATNVGFLKFSVTNGGSSSATVSQVTVKRSGAGSSSDFSNVYLYQGSTRLTSGRSVNSSSNEAVFSGLNVSVPASGSVTFDVTADIASGATAGDVNAFSVSSIVLLSGSASGSATGNAMTIAGVSAGGITISDGGTPAAPKVGQSNAKVAEFTLAASSSEDLVVKRVALYQSGTINRSNLSNFKLVQNGSTLSTASSLDSKDRVTFDINFSLAKGNTRTFEVYADVGGAARSSETIILNLDENTDLYAVGSTFGFGAAVTDSYTGATLTLEGGQLTITVNGPSAKDVSKDGEDVEVLNFTMAAQNNLEVRQLGIDFDGGTGTANFCSAACGTQLYTDVKVWDTSTNTVVWGPLDFNDGNDTTESMTFSEDVTLPAGSSKTYKVTMDVGNDATVADGDDLRAFIDISDLTSSQVKNLDNNTFLTSSSIVPAADVYGNTVTVRVPSLAVTLATSPVSQTSIKGTNDVNFVGFNLTAGTGSDIKVTSLTVTGYIDENATGGSAAGTQNSVTVQQIVPSVWLKVDGAQVGNTKSPNATTGAMTFSGISINIPAGTTKTVYVYGNISTSAYVNSDAELISFDLADVSADISAADSSSNTVTATGDAANGGTTPNVGVTVQNAGSLSAGNAPTVVGQTDSRIVTAGKSGETLAMYKFTAANEELKITKMRVKLVSAAASANISDDVVNLSLYDGSTLIAGPVSLTPVTDVGTTDAQADFTSWIQNFVIPKNGSKTMTVKAELNSVGGGADSGDEFSAYLDYDTNFEARGTTGSTVVTSVGSADVQGNAVVLRASQPKVELVALPSTTLTNGTQPVFKFKVTAVDHDVALKHVEFTTAVSDDAGITLSAPALRESGQTSDIGATVAITDGASTPSDITFTSEQTIAAGTSKTYEFRVNVLGAGAGDTLATSIDTDTTQVTGELDTPLAADQLIDDIDGVLNVGNDADTNAAQNFIWSDMSAIPHNDTVDAGAAADDAAASNDWTSGRYVTIPTDTQTMTFPS